VIGSVVASSFTRSIDSSGLPGQLIAAARPSIADADADAVAAHAGPLAPHLLQVAHDGFTTAMTTGFTVAGLVAVAAAVLTGIALPRRAARQPDAEAAPAAQRAPGLAGIGAA
jgi:hypothetical protein